MKLKLTHILIVLALVACGKTISVKEDAANYAKQESQLQAEMQTEQRALMQKLQAMQKTPEKIDEIMPEVNQFIAQAKTKVQNIKTETAAVKKFQAQELKSIDELSVLLSTIVDAVKTKDISKVQTAQMAYSKAITDMQVAKAELTKAAAE